MTESHRHPEDPHRSRQDPGATARRLAATLALVVVYMVAEVIGGLLSGSLALLADAAHMLSDAGALALSLAAIRMAARPRDLRRTYGYQRAEVLAALVQGVVLLGIPLSINVEAVGRLLEPTAVTGRTVLLVAAGGLAVNLAGLWILHGSAEGGLNVRGARLHVWSISSCFVALSAHLVVDGGDSRGLIVRARQMLDRRFHIGHTTLQLERSGGGEGSEPEGVAS